MYIKAPQTPWRENGIKQIHSSAQRLQLYGTKREISTKWYLPMRRGIISTFTFTFRSVAPLWRTIHITGNYQGICISFLHCQHFSSPRTSLMKTEKFTSVFFFFSGFRVGWVGHGFIRLPGWNRSAVVVDKDRPYPRLTPTLSLLCRQDTTLISALVLMKDKTLAKEGGFLWFCDI